MASQLKTGAFLSYASIVINILIGLLYTPWMLHSIGRDNFGLYTLAMSVITLFVFDFGLSSAVTRFIAKYLAEGRQDKADNCLGIVYKLYFLIDIILLIVMTAVYFFIPYIYDSLTPDEISKFKVVYVIAAIFSVISFPFIPVNGILTANEKFIQLKLCDLINKILIVALMSGCLLLGFGLYALVTVNAVAGLIMIGLKLYCIKRFTNTHINFGYKNSLERKEILLYSGWSTIISLCDRIIMSLAPSILGIMSGAGSIAVLGIAITIQGYTITFATALNGMFLPKVSRIVIHDNQNLTPLMIKIGRVQVLIVFTIFLFFSCVGYNFIDLWVGPQYSSSYWCALLLIIPEIIHQSQTIGLTAIVATNHIKYTAYIFIVMALCSVALAFWFSSLWGAIGISASICITYMIRTLGLNMIYKHKLSIKVADFFKSTYHRLWIPTLLTVACAYGLNLLNIPTNWGGFLVKFGVLLIVCVSSYWMFYMNKDEHVLFSAIFTKAIAKINKPR